jgi:UDP-N-acetylmuramate--alanine ligase
VLRYGLSADADVRATDLRQDGLRMRFTVHRPAPARPLAVELALAGRHNVQNALAAIAVAHKLGLPDAALVAALAEFQGIDRRFQILGEMEAEGGRALVLDDYAHHPCELTATLEAAAGAWPQRRLVVVFQPHRYTRTRDLLDDFSAVLASRDPLVIVEVYAAGEAPIAGADGRALCRAIRARGRTDPVFVPHIAELPAALAALVRDGDVVLALGAGDIGRAAAQMVRAGGNDAGHG